MLQGVHEGSSSAVPSCVCNFMQVFFLAVVKDAFFSLISKPFQLLPFHSTPAQARPVLVPEYLI